MSTAQPTDQRDDEHVGTDNDGAVLSKAPIQSLNTQPMPQKHEALGESNKQTMDTTSDWTIISDATTQYDEQTIADWKDDLANLLVFSGLFSSVIAGFTVDSYKWLQQSSGPDPFLQVQLLAQISAQLSSFSVSSGFVNSTTQPPAPTGLQDTTSASQVHLNVRINTLWFVSLGISLISSLLAIMVQQWLRGYRLPGHLTIRERVRLRQYRYQGLLDWGVPQIISSLSVLLQISLILFLSGLCYLLSSLDKTVAKSFIALVGVALATYSAFIILPIAFRRCPYKNPIAHAITWTAQMIALPCWLCAMIALGSGLLIFGGIMFATGLVKEGVAGSLRLDFRDKLVRRYMMVTQLMSKIFNFVFDPLSDFEGRNYWTARELHVLPNVEDLDLDALIWAPNAVAQADFPRLVRCLHDLDPKAHERCILSWAAQALNIDRIAFDSGVGVAMCPFNLQTLAKIDKTFAERFQDMMLSLLPEEIIEPSWPADFYSPSVLVMLRHIARTEAVSTDFTTRYTEHVLSIREKQPDSQIKEHNAWTRLPTPCLFECSTILRYEFTLKEISSLFDYAIQMQEMLFPLEDMDIIFVTHLEPILVSAATALHALSRRVPLNFPMEDDTEIEQQLRTKCRNLLVRLDKVLVTEKGRMQLLATYPVDWALDGVLLCTIPAATTLCQSVVALVEAGMIPSLLHEEDEDLTLSSLVDHIIDTFESETAYGEAAESLVEYRSAHPTVPMAGPSSLNEHGDEHKDMSSGSVDMEKGVAQVTDSGVTLPKDNDTQAFELLELSYEGAASSLNT